MWRRLPTYFPNIRISMLPLSKEQHKQLLDTGWLREVAFKTEPRVNKFELKAFFESVHGMEVERVTTINYQGKRKCIVDEKGRGHWRRLSDWKKAYVIFKPPPEIQQQWEQQQQEKAANERKMLQKQQRQMLAQRKRERASLLPPVAAAALPKPGKQ